MEDSFTDEDADDSLGDLVRTFKTKLVIMSPTREDSPLDNYDDENARTSSADRKRGVTDKDGVVADLSQRFDESNLEPTSPSSLKELCRLANPFDTVGVTQAQDRGDAGIPDSNILRDPVKQALVASTRSSSAIPFETQVYVKGSLNNAFNARAH